MVAVYCMVFFSSIKSSKPQIADCIKLHGEAAVNFEKCEAIFQAAEEGNISPEEAGALLATIWGSSNPSVSSRKPGSSR